MDYIKPEPRRKHRCETMLLTPKRSAPGDVRRPPTLRRGRPAGPRRPGAVGLPQLYNFRTTHGFAATSFIPLKKSSFRIFLSSLLKKSLLGVFGTRKGGGAAKEHQVPPPKCPS